MTWQRVPPWTATSYTRCQTFTVTSQLSTWPNSAPRLVQLRPGDTIYLDKNHDAGFVFPSAPPDAPTAPPAPTQTCTPDAHAVHAGVPTQACPSAPLPAHPPVPQAASAHMQPSPHGLTSRPQAVGIPPVLTAGPTKRPLTPPWLGQEGPQHKSPMLQRGSLGSSPPPPNLGLAKRKVPVATYTLSRGLQHTSTAAAATPATVPDPATAPAPDPATAAAPDAAARGEQACVSGVRKGGAAKPGAQPREGPAAGTGVAEPAGAGGPLAACHVVFWNCPNSSILQKRIDVRLSKARWHSATETSCFFHRACAADACALHDGACVR